MDKDVLRILKPPLFSFQECQWFLDRGYDDCLFKITKDEIRKTILIEGKPVLFSLKDDQEDLTVTILQGQLSDKGKESLEDYVIEWFDLKRNLLPFYALLEKNLCFSYMTEAFSGLRLISIADLFEALCWSIIGQQINLTFAYKLKRKLIEQYGSELRHEGENYHTFPSPDAVARLSIDELKALQFSANKAKYLIGVAQSFSDNKLSKDILLQLSTPEARLEALTNLNGIGNWTANYVMMKTLREPTAIPVGDVGLLKALETHRIINNRNEVEKIASVFEGFKGWESYLVFYLWRSLSTSAFQNK